MLKLTMLLAVVMTTACALDENTSSVEGASTPCGGDCGCDNECPPPPPPEGPICTIRGVDIDLDSLPANEDHEDERVSFCHATGSETNPYVLLRTSIEGCNGHANENHAPGGNTDIFPSQGCAD